MPKKADVEEEVAATEEAVEEEAAPAAKGKKTEVTVVFPGGQRTYSAADHGPDFAKLAAQFAEKKRGRVV